MPRAVAVFRKVGFPVEPWPVDYRTAGPGDAWKLFDAPTEGLKRLEMAVHEWVGLIIPIGSWAAATRCSLRLRR
jgi:uncharacterized SAM-binding protein YcdF (DUF218 family)